MPGVGGQLRVLGELAGSGNLELPRCRSLASLLNLPHLQAVQVVGFSLVLFS